MRGQATLFASARTKKSRDKGSTDDWGTPRRFYDLLDKEFGFTLDPCASADNAKCAYFDIDDDGLAQGWGDNVCFVNFPYSQATAWAKKCVDASKRGATVVVLCASRTDTEWWQHIAQHADEVRFVKGRLRFVPPPGYEDKNNGAGFPSCVFVLRPGLEKCDLFTVLWGVDAEDRR